MGNLLRWMNCNFMVSIIQIFSERLLSDKLPGETKNFRFRELDCILGKALPIFHQLVDSTLLVQRSRLPQAMMSSILREQFLTVYYSTSLKKLVDQ